MTVKGPRSVMPPINAVLSPDGNTITLYSPENCDRAFVTISGNGTYLTEMVNFGDQIGDTRRVGPRLRGLPDYRRI